MSGALVVAIEDDRIDVSADGATWHLPVGPRTLLERELERADPPSPVHLTNALAVVGDHVEDILNEAPDVATIRPVVARGPHAVALARVEIGRDEVPPGYRLRRADAEEVFRTLVAEPVADRRFNPGLPEDHVETIIGACCVVLAVVRRLDLTDIEIDSGAGRSTDAGTG